jgi:hypothetical protein
MSKEISSHAYGSVESYLKIAASYSAPKLGLLLLRHPLHVIATSKQAYPELTNLQTISHIYTQSGLRGFYKSANTSVVKAMASESYRGILGIKVPQAVRAHLLPSWMGTHQEKAALATSLIATPIISVVDATIICPVVRMATLQITTDKSSTLTSLYKKHIQTDVLRQLYRGYTPLLTQTACSWGIFFLADDLSAFLLNKDFKQPSVSQLTFAALLGGSAQTFINVIPDTIRVHMQKTEAHHLNMRNTLQHVVKVHGVRSLFSVVPHKIAGNILSYGYRNALKHFFKEPEK